MGAAERVLISSMIQAMYEHKGVGLAAPQVGINEQIFVVDIGDGPFAMINPSLIKKRGSEIMEEGCLSVPGILIKVKRPKNIIIQYLDENNTSVERECSDLLARVILHEIDHLNGRLIVDNASWREKLRFKKQMKAVQKKQSGDLKI